MPYSQVDDDYPSDVDNTSKSETGEGESGNTDVMIMEEPVSVVEKKVYDLMDDLLEIDVLKLYRMVLTQEEAQVKSGVKDQFGYLTRMVLTNIGVMNTKSFCERTLSCTSLTVTDLHTSLSREGVRMITMLTDSGQ